MHPYTIPASVKDRVIRRQGKLASHDTIDAGRTALVVVDMQNYFVAKGFPLEVPVARDIVPNINKLARAIRAAGGTVVWLQTSTAAALKHWARHHAHMLTPERSKTRLAYPRRVSGRLCPLSGAGGAAGRSAGQEDHVQRIHADPSEINAALRKPRRRKRADYRHRDQCLLRVDRARRHDA